MSIIVQPTKKDTLCLKNLHTKKIQKVLLYLKHLTAVTCLEITPNLFSVLL